VIDDRVTSNGTGPNELRDSPAAGVWPDDDGGFASRRVTRVLDAIVAERRPPLAIRLRQWAGLDESAFSAVVCGAADRQNA